MNTFLVRSAVAMGAVAALVAAMAVGVLMVDYFGGVSPLKSQILRERFESRHAAP